MTKKIILGIVVVLSLLMISAALGPLNIGQQLGELYKNYQLASSSQKDSKIIFSSGTIEISQAKFDFIKQQYLLANSNLDDMQILEKIIVKELLYQEAVAAGVTISDQTVQAEIEKIKSMLPKNKEGYQGFNDFLKESGLTEEEYWQVSFEFYKKAWTTGKYIKEVLRVNYINQQTDKTKVDSTIEEDFSAYLSEYKEKLLETNKIDLTAVEFDK